MVEVSRSRHTSRQHRGPIVVPCGRFRSSVVVRKIQLFGSWILPMVGWRSETDNARCRRARHHALPGDNDQSKMLAHICWEVQLVHLPGAFLFYRPARGTRRTGESHNPGRQQLGLHIRDFISYCYDRNRDLESASSSVSV